MAFGYPTQDPTPPAPPVATDVAAELEKVRQQLQDQQNQFQALRNHNLQATTAANQQIELLRGQLSDQLVRQQPQTAAPAAGQTDDWMAFLTGGNPASTPTTTPTQPPAGLRPGLTEEQVRQVYRDEQNKQSQAYAQEHQKVAELNARFVVEYPELAKNPLAVACIKNGYQAASNLRPDLPADLRYKMAIENTVKELLPDLQPHITQHQQQEEKKPKAPVSNPYMPNIFQAAPGQRPLEERLGIVSNESLDAKFSKREAELKAERARQRALQGR